jgi:hypothetical protein
MNNQDLVAGLSNNKMKKAYNSGKMIIENDYFNPGYDIYEVSGAIIKAGF